MQARWITWGIAALLAACGINTEPVTGQADAGFTGGGAEGGGGFGGGGGGPGAFDAEGAPDAGASEADMADLGVRFDSCDVDLTCTEGCAEDLDCGPDRDGTDAPEDAPASLAEAVGGDEELGLMMGEDAWFTWPTEVAARAVQLTRADGGAPQAVLVLYASDWTAVARAEPDPDDPQATLQIELPPNLGELPEGPLVLRIHARADLMSWRLAFVE